VQTKHAFRLGHCITLTRTTDAMRARPLSPPSNCLQIAKGDLRMQQRDTRDCMYKKNVLLFKIATLTFSFFLLKRGENTIQQHRIRVATTSSPRTLHTQKELLQRTKVMDASLRENRQ